MISAMTPAITTPRGRGCVVEASAGTGKTRRLVQEIATALAQGVPVDRIAAVTFTHAAAGNMKVRVRQELEARRQPDDTLLKTALRTLDRAFIGTIHGFCANLLRQRPVEAQVDPDFIGLEQGDASRVFAGVFRTWMERRLGAPTPGVSRALARLAERRGDPLAALEKAAWNLTEWRDHDKPWEHREFERRDQLKSIVGKAKHVHQMWKQGYDRDTLRWGLTPLDELMQRIQSAAKAGIRNLDDAEADILGLKQQTKWWKEGQGSNFGPGLPRQQMVDAWKDLLDAIEQFREVADADLAATLRDELWEVVGLYQKAKTRAGQLDFADLLIATRDLLRNEEARADLRARYDRIFVDEFQDTDPLQSAILLDLCGDDALQAGKLFVVGDPKQSIYRFRRADAREYNRVRGVLTEAGVPLDRLQVSHRSTEPMQAFVNAAFETDMPDYLPLTGGRAARPNQPAVIALPIPYMHGQRNVSAKVVNEHAPSVTAAFIDWLLKKSGYRIWDGAKWAPVTPGDICVLFRKTVRYNDDLTQQYVRALESREIPHVMVGSKSFHRREEIGTLRAALRAIEWPDDEFSVFAVLRGSLFFIDDTTLLKFREKYGRFSATPEEDDFEFQPVAEALGVLKRLHKRRNKVPLAETIQDLLRLSRAPIGFALQHGGERRLANVYRLCDLARGFETSNLAGSSFRAFIEYLDQELEESEAPILEQQSGGVQLMTAHKSKGLEFPVVILADPTTHAQREDGSERHVDVAQKLCAQRLCGWAPWELVANKDAENAEDAAEAWRIAYVAATRAKDLLVVTAVGAGPWEDSWLGPLYPALYPPKDRWTTVAPSTVWDFPSPGKSSVKLGVHAGAKGGCEVLWLDPGKLTLDEPESHGLERGEMLAGTAEQKKQGLEAWQAWRQTRETGITQASHPLFEVRLASSPGDVSALAEVQVEYAQVEWEGQRPSNRIFGKMVHAILQSADTPAAAEALAVAQGHRWGASSDVVQAAAGTALAVLNEITRRTADATEIHREWPICVKLPSGELVEGVIDLAWSDGESWTVLDYKTGRPDEKQYKTQVRLYALALHAATGLAARAVLLEV